MSTLLRTMTYNGITRFCPIPMIQGLHCLKWNPKSATSASDVPWIYLHCIEMLKLIKHVSISVKERVFIHRTLSNKYRRFTKICHNYIWSLKNMKSLLTKIFPVPPTVNLYALFTNSIKLFVLTCLYVWLF